MAVVDGDLRFKMVDRRLRPYYSDGGVCAYSRLGNLTLTKDDLPLTSSRLLSMELIWESCRMSL